MSRIDLVALAHEKVARSLCNGEIAIDATVGNGHDTLFLAHTVGPTGHVYGFDIQPAAIASTRLRLEERGLLPRTTLLQCGHEKMGGEIPVEYHDKIKAVTFNLGYLPGNTHAVHTHSSTTLQALKSALALLAPQGIITVIAYTGHEHGREETEEVKTWARSLEQSNYKVEITIPPSRLGNAPELIVIRHVA